jgi:essential nuclear protein 1
MEDEIEENATPDEQRKRLASLTDKALLVGDYDDDDNTQHDVDDEAFEYDDDNDGDDYDYTRDLNIEMSSADREALDMFLPKQSTPHQNLGDVILQKMQDREAASNLGLTPASREGDVELKPTVSRQVINVYHKVGAYLKKYRSGKLPKPFKIVPTLKNWEEVLYYTNPMEWSSQATNAAVRLFSATFNPKMAQRFYSLVLVPKVQAMVEADGRLNFHIYDALKRAIYKPTAFFKGIILPMAAQGCSSREAICYASVLSKISIPTMHAAVTMLQLAKMPFNSVACLFMRVLLNKKFSLPLPVLAAVTEHFYKTINDDIDYSVLWFRTLLTFVQRYKYSLTMDQVAMLKALVKKKHHRVISDEVRRELIAASGAGPIGTQAVIDDNIMM